jgi:hypothetical protein
MLTLLLLVFCQDIKLPAEVTAQPGTFVSLIADTKGETVKFTAIDPGVSLFPAELLANKKSTVAVAMAAGRYRVLAWTAIDGKPTDAVQVTLVVGNAPGPVPPSPPAPPPPAPPPVPPGPPAPVDDLAQILAALYGALNEDGKAAHVKALAGVFREAGVASADNRYQTVGQLFGAIRQQSLQALPNTALTSMRERLGLVLTQALGNDPAAPLTPSSRAKAFETFGRIASILEALR